MKEGGALEYAIDLARSHYEEIGFIPRPQMEKYERSGQLWVERENDELCGFLVWGKGWPILRVYQVCIQYDAQRRLHGCRLISRLIQKAETEGYEAISCWVADDIPANDFWHSMGFRLAGRREGGARRGRMHNAWVYACSSPMQLKIAV